MSLFWKALKIVCATMVLSFTLICLQPQLLNKFYHYYVGSNVFKIKDFISGSSGTGFYVVSPSGNKYIMTNNHVCNMNATMLVAEHQHSQKTFSVEIYKQSPDHDLCLLKLTKAQKLREGLPFYIRGLRVANNVKAGDIMTVVGHPLGNPLTVSKGEIIGQTTIKILIGYNLTEEQCFGENVDVETTEELNDLQKMMFKMRGITKVCIANPVSTMNTSITFPGNSGSPAVNHNFRVAGVLFAGNPDQPTQSFVVPLEYVKRFLKDK